MYSEIKSSEQILINRLDENERIILEDIYNKSQQEGTEISLEKLTDESGDFGGVLVDIKTDSTKPSIELKNEIPEVETAFIGDTINLSIEADVKDNTLIVYAGSDNHDNINITVTDNIINIECTNITSSPAKLYYSVSAEGYKTLNGVIDINILAKENQLTKIKVFNDSDVNITSDCNINLVDESETQYILTYDSDISAYRTNLPIGRYSVSATYKESGNSVGSTTFVISEELLLNPESTEISISETQSY